MGYLLLLTLPSWFARYAMRKEKIGWKGLEDLGYGAFFLLLYFIPIFPYVFIPILQVLILFDAFLEKKLGSRLCWHHLAFLSRIGEFRDSAKEVKAIRYIFFTMLLASLSLFIKPFSFSYGYLGLLFLPFMSFGRGTKHFLSYTISRKSKLKGEEKLTPRISKTEDYKRLYPGLPLYRVTQGFHGKKTFELQIDRGEKPHILFLFVESLGVKNLKIPNVTPNLDRLADEGIYFPHFYSHSLQTYRSIFSSLYGIPSIPTLDQILKPHLSARGLIELLREEGYESRFYNGATWSLNNLKLFLKSRNVEGIADSREIMKKFPNAEKGSWGVYDEHLYDYVLEDLVKHQGSPQFINMMTITTHHPYSLPLRFPTLKGNHQEKFIEALRYADRCLGDFIHGLENAGLLEKMLLFVMGDHGNLIDERTGNFILPVKSQVEDYNVPLIIYGKGRVTNGQIVKGEGCQSDLLPTLLDMLKIQGKNHSTGKSLLREETLPIFLFNNNFPMDDYRMRGETDDYSAKNKLAFLLSIYEKNRFAPKHIEEEKDSYYLTLKGIHDVDDHYIEENVPSSICCLDLHRSPYLTDDSLIKLAKRCPDLIELDISNCMLVSTEGIYECFQYTHLEHLTINGIDFEIKPNCPIVESIRVFENLRASLENPECLPKIFPNLSILFISVGSVSQKGLLELIERSAIEKLYLYGCQFLDDAFIEELSEKGQQLRTLALYECYQLTDQSVQHFGKMSQLVSLKLTHPVNLTDNSLKTLLKLPLSQLRIKEASGLSKDATIRAHKQNSKKYDYLLLD